MLHNMCKTKKGGLQKFEEGLNRVTFRQETITNEHSCEIVENISKNDAAVRESLGITMNSLYTSNEELTSLYTSNEELTLSECHGYKRYDEEIEQENLDDTDVLVATELLNRIFLTNQEMVMFSIHFLMLLLPICLTKNLITILEIKLVLVLKVIQILLLLLSQNRNLENDFQNDLHHGCRNVFCVAAPIAINFFILYSFLLFIFQFFLSIK